MYKVPGRSIICSTIGEWIREIIWCYVVMKLLEKILNQFAQVQNQIYQSFYRNRNSEIKLILYSH